MGGRDDRDWRWWCPQRPSVVVLSLRRCPASTKVKAAGVWTLWTGAVCGTETFGMHHTFVAVGSNTGLDNGDKGTYK